MSATVLSTKKLTPAQKSLLLSSGIGLVERNFISIVPTKFEVTEIPQNLIFTSKNAVKIILEHPKSGEFRKRNCFCVGEKTAEFLRVEGFTVVEKAGYGAELGKLISEKYRRESFLFFCGKKRNPDLPEILQNENIQFSEVKIYDTVLSPRKYERKFDGVMFFSPSGVESFCSENELFDTPAFCIGTTTVEKAKEFTDRIIIANKPTVENVIVQVVKKLKTYDLNIEK